MFSGKVYTKSRFPDDDNEDGDDGHDDECHDDGHDADNFLYQM